MPGNSTSAASLGRAGGAGFAWLHLAAEARVKGDETMTTTVKHTPGPWKIVGTETEPWTIAGPNGTSSIAEVTYMGGNAEANARLIAASPMMLAACEAALDGFHYTREYVGEAMLPETKGWSWYDAVLTIKAAIQTATGGTE